MHYHLFFVTCAAYFQSLAVGVHAVQTLGKAEDRNGQKSLGYHLSVQKLDSPDAIALLQRNALLKARPKIHVTLAANRSRPVNHLKKADGVVKPCSIYNASLPLVMQARGSISGFQDLGVRKTKNCREPDLISDDLLSTAREGRNKAAYWFAVTWLICAVALIMWSIVAVAKVPRKRGSFTTCKEKLADEEAAWTQGFITWMNLSWADGLMGRYGKCLHAKVDDAEILPRSLTAPPEAHLEFREAWQKQVEQSGGIENASFTKAFLDVVGTKSCLAIVIGVMLDFGVGQVGMVIALDVLLRTLADTHWGLFFLPELATDLLPPTVTIIVLMFGVPMLARLASIVVSLLDGYYTSMCSAGLAALVYEKALKLPVGRGGIQDKNQADDSQASLKPNVVQLLNVDIIEAWSYLLKSLVYAAFAPIVFAILFAMLILRLKHAALVGSLYFIPGAILAVLLQMKLMASFRKYQNYQDHRLACVAETLLQIRTIKCLALDKLAFLRIHKAREQEISSQFKLDVSHGYLSANMHTIPFFTTLLTCVVAGKYGGGIQAVDIFIIQRIMMSLLSELQIFVDGMNKLVVVPNNFARIKAFLMLPERPRNLVKKPAALDGTGPAPAVRLLGNFTFVEDAAPVLHNLNLSIRQGELVAVVGGVGSGKSALLQTITGDLFPCAQTSSIQAPLELAYCSQVPWIFEGTLRENVLLNQAFEYDRYYEALQNASLGPDLHILAGGDHASIGSFGIRLSAGQCSRVALARAAYMNKDLVLLDDPFAPLDTPTMNRVFDDLLLGPGMRQKTRVVVMQPDVRCLSKFDRILLMKDGCIIGSGSPADVVAMEAFQHLCKTCLLPDASNPGDIERTEPKMDAESLAQSISSASLDAGGGSKLREAEVAEHFSWTTIKWWLRAAGYSNLVIFWVSLVWSRMVQLAESLVLAKWVDMKTIEYVDDRIYEGLLLAVVLTGCAGLMLEFWVGAHVTFWVTRKIHNEVLQKLLRAPIDKFFDRQPIGRLINRLSADLLEVSGCTGPIIRMAMFFLGMLITQIYILSRLKWWFTIISLPVYGVMFFFIYLYRGTAVPLVFHSKLHLSTAHDLQGVVLSSCSSIRANGMADDFCMKYRRCSASVTRCQYLIFHVTKAWVQSRIALCFCVLTAGFAISGLWCKMPMGTLTNIILLSFALMADFDWVALCFSRLINVFNALQRLMRYFDIPQEGAAELPNDPKVRLSVIVSRNELAGLEVKRSSAEEAFVPQGVADRRAGKRSRLIVYKDGGVPILQASQDNVSLELMEGCTLADLAPRCEGICHIKDRYNIIAVNNACKDAFAMAEELCDPPTTLWIDLWHTKYKDGLRITLEDLTAGYGAFPSTLHNINIDIPPCARVGLTGRTGSGKSTVLLCMLRILEPRSGRISVGGMDTRTIGLDSLRSTVGLVPQEPTVFEGTWRYNVDPFGKYPDGRVWDVLQRVQLMPFIRGLPDGIDSDIVREGANMSIGQRQLLSLARMVIRQPPVLLLDECTSALTTSAQEAIQTSLTNDFPMSTIVAVSHRVRTILDFDMIIVLDDGAVVEQGNVEDLLAIKDGAFSKLVKAGSQ